MKKKPRRGSAGIGLGGGLFAALLSFENGAVPDSDFEAKMWHYAIAAVVTIGPFLIEKVTDWLNARTGANFTDTGDAIVAAIGDGNVTRAEVKQIVSAAVDDTADLFNDYRHDGESHGPDAPESQPDYPQDVTH